MTYLNNYINHIIQ